MFFLDKTIIQPIINFNQININCNNNNLLPTQRHYEIKLLV